MGNEQFARLIAFGAGVSAAAHLLPDLARAMEMAALQERQFAAMATLGVKDSDLKRMQRFVVALAQSQITPNSDIIMAAHGFNLRRMAVGEDLLPADIRRWATDFWNYEARDLFDTEFRRLYGWGMLESGYDQETLRQFADDAQRIWQETPE